jgi:hypothetical protein
MYGTINIKFKEVVVVSGSKLRITSVQI